MKVAVVHDIPLDEERKEMIDAVVHALKSSHQVDPLPFDESFMLKVKHYDVVFNLSSLAKQVHVPALLELLNVPYTGSDPLGHALCIDKSVTKTILKHHGIPTPQFITAKPNEKVPEIDFYPAIVKPSREGSAKGLTRDSVVHDYDSLMRAVKRVWNEFSQPALIDEFIDGREFSVGIVDNNVLPILEIDFSSLPEGLERFYSYRVKHNYSEQTRYVCPAQIPHDLENKIKRYALSAFKALNLRNYARMDLRIRGKEIFFLEVNSLPLLVPEYSDITKMAKAANWSYEELVTRILNTALKF